MLSNERTQIGGRKHEMKLKEKNGKRRGKPKIKKSNLFICSCFTFFTAKRLRLIAAHVHYLLLSLKKLIFFSLSKASFFVYGT